MAQHRLDTVQFGGFDQIVGGAGAQRGDGAVHCGVTGHDDQFGRIRGRHLAGQLDALAVRQPQVGEHDIGPFAAQLFAGRLQGLGAAGGESLQTHHLLQPTDHVRVVVDNERVGHVRQPITEAEPFNLQ